MKCKNLKCSKEHDGSFGSGNYCLEHNISIVRNVNRYPYIDNDGIHRYYIPDFIVNGQIVEIKGYKEKNFYLKVNACPNVLVLFRHDLRECFKYVESKYGKNFINLYQKQK